MYRAKVRSVPRVPVSDGTQTREGKVRKGEKRMTSASSRNPKPSKGETRPWVLERMVHRAQPHLSETETRPFSPALILGGIIVLMLIVCLGLSFFLGRTLNLGSVSSTPDASGILFATTPTSSRSSPPASSPATT